MQPHLLVYTPVMPGGLRHEMVASVTNQQTHGLRLTWKIGRCNPYPPPDVRNVLAQYELGRELFLSGPYDALVTIEQDVIAPPHAIQTLWEDGAGVVYGTYMLRHGRPVVNALRYEGRPNLGMSLSLYDGKLPTGRVAVSGVGFGCTLMRWGIVERIPFRSEGGQAPDMSFARDCLKLGIAQNARFDVKCGHVHEGVILETKANDGMVTVTAKEDCNLLIDGKSVALAKGDSVEMPADAAADYAALGYVEVGKAAPTREGVPGSPQGPKVPRSQ